jgi:uncharacterized protein
MEIIDRVYGRCNITEQVLIELIGSRPVQRLKGINQAGASQYALPNKDISRYEHSVGVMLLLQRLGASVEEQIAGLLHDIPHTAFSHVIDFVYNDEKHEFHERFHQKILLSSEIPAILEKHGLFAKAFLDEKRFTLLEMDLPDLCADRIDYALRDMAAYDGSGKNAAIYVDCFTARDGQIFIKDGETAFRFANDYLRMDLQSWSNPKEIALFQILADAIRIALDEGIMTQEDLFGDDSSAYQKLSNCCNERIKEKLQMINPSFEIREDENDYDIHSTNKLRYIDPKFIDNEQVLRVTDRYPIFQETLRLHQERVKKGVYVKVIAY